MMRPSCFETGPILRLTCHIAWKNAVLSETSPTCLVLTRQNTTAISRSKEQIMSIESGGYLLNSNADANIMKNSCSVLIKTREIRFIVNPRSSQATTPLK